MSFNRELDVRMLAEELRIDLDGRLLIRPNGIRVVVEVHVSDALRKTVPPRLPRAAVVAAVGARSTVTRAVASWILPHPWRPSGKSSSRWASLAATRWAAPRRCRQC